MLVRRAARPMLAGLFVLGGLDGLRDPGPREEAARRLGASEPRQAARLHAAAMLVAGAGLATGRLPRLSALVLAATLVPTTWAGHAFWSASGPERARQRVQFLKNLGIGGGLLLAAVDTGGRDSLRRRAGRAARGGAREARLVAARTEVGAARAGRRARRRLRGVRG